jgi:hypothetical protein
MNSISASEILLNADTLQRMPAPDDLGAIYDAVVGRPFNPELMLETEWSQQ